MARSRLKKGDITIREILLLSKKAYKSEIDDKSSRAKIDIKGGRLVTRNNYTYDRSTRTWKQTGRNIKLIFSITSVPTSYDKIDTIKKHVYPVYILIQDIEKGLDSPFRWRVGSFKKPRFAKKGSTKKKRQQVANTNIRNKVQMQFFFELMQVLDTFHLLYGPNTTNRRKPTKANPKNTIFMDKHMFFIVNKILVPVINKAQKLIKDVSYKNEEL